MLPIRCFTCNKVLGNYNEVFDLFKKKHPEPSEKDYKKFFTDMVIRRYCCRKIFLTHVDIYENAPVFRHENIVCKDKCTIPRILKAD